MGTQHYFKYRDLTNIERFIDILLRKRLYMSTYSELNDPMEGVFLYDDSTRSENIQIIRNQKKETYICSLSRKSDNMLMWSHYANGHTGCCIEISVTSKKEDLQVRDIEYKNHKVNLNENILDVYKILSVKSPLWKYEDETRYFRQGKNGKRPFLKVKIYRIIFGTKVSPKEFSFYKRLINAIDNSIIVEKMTRDKLNTGYDNM